MAFPAYFVSSRALFLLLGACALWACSDGAATPADSGVLDLGATTETDASAPIAPKLRVDGGFPSLASDAGVLPASRFASRVVSFTPGDCAGFGVGGLPDVVLGPPEGAGDGQGGMDVLSLGVGGAIVLSFEADPIVDGPGVDFLVFENAFYAAGSPEVPFAEPATVSVSDDGVEWKTYPCTATSAPYGACAGWHPVYSASTNALSPFDPAAAGGDPFDLAEVGLTRARFVRIVDRGLGGCPANPNKLTTGGFDLDAVASVNHAGSALSAR